MHFHWHVRVNGDSTNGYYVCRCGSRVIRQRDRGRPMDYSWLARGTFHEMPLTGPPGYGNSERARRLADLESGWWYKRPGESLAEHFARVKADPRYPDLGTPIP